MPHRLMDRMGERTSKRIAPELEWTSVQASMRSAVPEAFDGSGRVLNLLRGEWSTPGTPRAYHSPVDGRPLGALPMLDLETARAAVRFAASEAARWARTDLDERRRRVSKAIAEMRKHETLIARLLMWEIGKPWAQARTDVERCLSGVEWYVGEMESMLENREPLGLVSNIASWNYPMSVLVHAVLVQLLAGNAVIAKTPTDGGLLAVTVAFALMRRAGLPVSLVSGSGGQLSEALVRSPEVACLAFVGGKANGREIAQALEDQKKRYMLEMEGVNAYGIWEFSDWQTLADQLRKGFDYGKQRCTAYVRYVVQRRLFPQFLEAYLPVLRSIRVGNPMLVSSKGEAPPELDFGPLIQAAKVRELKDKVDHAVRAGAIPLHLGALDESLFLADQDRTAYCAPAALVEVPKSSALYAMEPFGPIDTIVLVDTQEAFVAEMNVSNGALVGSIACDDPRLANRLASELRAFKVGINKMRSRGDREEAFGGIGQSWKGCFVGGRHLVRAVTRADREDPLCGNFPGIERLPDIR